MFSHYRLTVKGAYDFACLCMMCLRLNCVLVLVFFYQDSTGSIYLEMSSFVGTKNKNDDKFFLKLSCGHYHDWMGIWKKMNFFNSDTLSLCTAEQ